MNRRAVSPSHVKMSVLQRVGDWMLDNFSTDSPRGITILAVDDEPANLFTLRCMLENQGYQLDESSTGLEGVERVRQFSYDLILLDVMLPDIDGYEACRRIHEIRPGVPVILVTALSSSEDLKKGFDAGGMDYIKKPIDDIELLARVSNAIRISQAEAQIKSLYGALVADLEIASSIQRFMLPRPFLKTDQLMYSLSYAPCQKIGGDLCDVIPLSDDRCVVYMGDISGHGIQAALAMSAVKYTINSLVERSGEDLQPYEILNSLNQSLSGTVLKDGYVTLILGCMDSKKKTFVYYNAGHPSMLQYDLCGGEVNVLDELGSVPIGWGTDIEYLPTEQGCASLVDNKALVLYTDGVTEYADERGESLEIKGLQDLIAQVNTDNCPLMLPHRIKQTLLEGVRGQGRDDFSILAVWPTFRASGTLCCDLVETVRGREGRPMTRDRLLSGVGGVCRTVEQQIVAWSGDADLAARADMVTGEVLNNIVMHGLNDMDGSVLVIVFFDKGAVYLRFFDTGIDWEFPGPSDEEVGMLMESGRGMGIIYTLASSVTRTRVCDVNDTVVTLERCKTPQATT